MSERQESSQATWIDVTTNTATIRRRWRPERNARSRDKKEKKIEKKTINRKTNTPRAFVFLSNGPSGLELPPENDLTENFFLRLHMKGQDERRSEQEERE